MALSAMEVNKAGTQNVRQGVGALWPTSQIAHGLLLQILTMTIHLYLVYCCPE